MKSILAFLGYLGWSYSELNQCFNNLSGWYCKYRKEAYESFPLSYQYFKLFGLKKKQTLSYFKVTDIFPTQKRIIYVFVFPLKLSTHECIRLLIRFCYYSNDFSFKKVFYFKFYLEIIIG